MQHWLEKMSPSAWTSVAFMATSFQIQNTKLVHTHTHICQATQIQWKLWSNEETKVVLAEPQVFTQTIACTVLVSLGNENDIQSLSFADTDMIKPWVWGWACGAVGFCSTTTEPNLVFIEEELSPEGYRGILAQEEPARQPRSWFDVTQMRGEPILVLTDPGCGFQSCSLSELLNPISVKLGSTWHCARSCAGKGHPSAPEEGDCSDPPCFSSQDLGGRCSTNSWEWHPQEFLAVLEWNVVLFTDLSFCAHVRRRLDFGPNETPSSKHRWNLGETQSTCLGLNTVHQRALNLAIFTTQNPSLDKAQNSKLMIAGCFGAELRTVGQRKILLESAFAFVSTKGEISRFQNIRCFSESRGSHHRKHRRKFLRSMETKMTTNN